MQQPGFFDVDDRLAELSARGTDLERLAAVVDLEVAVPRKNRSKGGRPPFDHVFMFKVLILQTSHNLSDERTEYLIKDRLSFMRFLGLGLADSVPDANTIWMFHEALTKARIGGKPTIEVLFSRFDEAIRAKGFIPIVDATIVAATRKPGGRRPAGWKEKPAKLAQKDRDARWTVKYSKAKPREDGQKQVDLAIPAFIGIDKTHWLIRT